MSAMTMRQCNQGRPNAIWRSLKTAEETKISMTNADNSDHISHRLLHLVQDNFACATMQNAEIIYLSLSYEDIVKELHTRRMCASDKKSAAPAGILESMESIWAGQYVSKKGKFVYAERDLDDIVSDVMHAKKSAFIVMDIDDYSVESLKGVHEYTTHSVFMYLAADADGANYKLHYFNSHGNYIGDYEYFNFIGDDDKVEKFQFNGPVEFMIMDEFAKLFETTYNDLYEEFLEKEQRVSVVYRHNSSHNYLGPNLQNGDRYGVCFAYPLLIVCKFIIEIDIKTIHNDDGKQRMVMPLGDLIANGYFTEAITSMFLDFSDEFKRLYFEYIGQMNEHKYGKINSLDADLVKVNQEDMVNDMDITLEEESAIFVKKVTHTIIGFLTQEVLQKKLINYM